MTQTTNYFTAWVLAISIQCVSNLIGVCSFLFLGKMWVLRLSVFHWIYALCSYSNSLVLLLNNRQFLIGGISTVTGSQNTTGMLGAGVAVKMSTFRSTEPSHSGNTMPVSLDGTMIGDTTEWDGKLIPVGFIQLLSRSHHSWSIG